MNAITIGVNLEECEVSETVKLYFDLYYVSEEYTGCRKMMYYRLIAYMSITNEPIFKNFVLSNCQNAKLCI